MLLDPKRLEIKFQDCAFGVSARRIYEHMALGQVNPFARTLWSVRSRSEVTELLDLVYINSPKWYSLTGLTLRDIDNASLCRALLGDRAAAAQLATAQGAVRDFVAAVESAVKQHALRRAARNVPTAFLPAAETSDPFAVPLLRSRLCDYLTMHARTNARAGQWLGTIRNLTQKGFRMEELDRSGLIDFLQTPRAQLSPLSGNDVRQAVDLSTLRLSIIANITEARTQLRFEVVQDRRLPKIKREPKPQMGQQRRLRLFDRALGYRIEEVEHPALWGKDRHWQAVTFDGRVLRNRVTRRAIFESSDDAVARAQEHAREVLPKLLASERWVDWSWTGGEEYREWLITLPYYPASYFSGHFAVRNVLAHVRCDLREDQDGEKVLMLHEVQSDWMQQLRRAVRDQGESQTMVAKAPFLNEWPALTLKLMLLHAAFLGVNGLAWARGAHQVYRWRGLGAEGLKELYDRTLPREASRMLKPFGMTCETLEVYVPENFTIQRVEGAYEVRNAEGKRLGIAPSFREARDLLPDGAHERLYTVHGVRLSKDTRAAILVKGFAAWG